MIKEERLLNPFKRANLLSKLFFCYTAKLFLKGYKGELTEGDIFKVFPSHESKRLGHKLEKEWRRQVKKNRSSVFLLLFKCFGIEYFLLLLTIIIPLILIASKPQITKKFILYFASDHKHFTKIEACGYGVLLVLSVLIEALYRQNLELQLITFAYKIRAALTSLIYRRILKLELFRLDHTSTGNIINLITKDVAEFEDSVSFITSLVINTLNILILCCVLYFEIGWYFLVLVIMVATTLAVNALLSILVKNLKLQTLQKTDMRLQTTKESLNAITLIKYYLWGDYYENKLHDIRKREVSLISRIYILYFLKIIVSSTIIDASWYIIVISLIFSGIQSNVGTLFLILNSISSLYLSLQQIMPRAVHQVATMIAVFKRIRKFLRETDQLSKKAKDINSTSVTISLLHLKSDFADFEYSVGITAVTGPVGSGKSFLLKEIAQEHKSIDENLEDTLSMSYASQEPWLFPSTIKQNILFGSIYDYQRYLEVLRVCALLDDLQSLEDGDSTVVADRGVNLSKGQQARINLARAIYKNCDVYLLDDCLSHLDVIVADFIFEQCFRKFLNNKIVVIVTQNQQHLKRSDRIITIEDRAFKSDSWLNDATPNKMEEFVENKFSGGEALVEENFTESSFLMERVDVEENVYKEVKDHGKVKPEVYKEYVEACGGWLRIYLVFFFTVVVQVLQIAITKLEANWIGSEQIIFKNTTTTTDFTDALKNRSRMLYILPILILAVTILFMFNTIFYWVLAGKASLTLHKLLLSKVFNASAEFFNKHFTGNILNRFSDDVLYLDEIVPRTCYELLKYITDTCGIIILVATVNLYILLGCLVFGVIVTYLRVIYLRTGRALKRLEFSIRSPLVGHINATLEGLATIRISKMQNAQSEKFDKYQNLYTSCSCMCITYEKAFHFGLDACAVCFNTFAIIMFLILDEGISSDNVGLGLLQLYRFTITQYILYRTWSRLENYLTTVERILQYTKQKQETKEGSFVKNWPSNGEIRYEHVYLKYGTSNYVLKDINFVAKPKTKLAIVGRTASGKTSLTSTLLRLYGIEGSIFIDNVDIATLPLEMLRSNISFISQDPTLFTGTLRDNIDPTKKFSDDQIWSALETVNMSSLFKSLEDRISASDTTLSTGQKQLICLCRALVRNCKIVILDEITATVDSSAEALIHHIISTYFCHSTVILITHKLNYILEYDNVLVLDKGSVAEFGSPRTLLNNKNGLFCTMYQQQE